MPPISEHATETIRMPWVFFDTSWLAYRALFAAKGLPVRELPTAIVYSFLDQLYTTCCDPRVASNKVALFFDSGHSVRKEIYPAYKGNRHNDYTPEEQRSVNTMHQQLHFLRRFLLPQCGFQVFRQHGLESDDLIAQAALQIADDVQLNGIIISSDSDLYQCITQHSIHFYDPMRNNYITHLDMFFTKEVEPEDWATVKSIGGCVTDNVKGVPDVREKSAIDYLLGRLKKGSARWQAIKSKSGREIVARNRVLVTLPHPLTQPIDLTTPTYDTKLFFAKLNEFGFGAYLRGGREAQWRGFFNGDTQSVNNKLAAAAEGRQGMRKRT